MIYFLLRDGCLIYESAYRRKNDACYLHFVARSCWFIHIDDNTIAPEQGKQRIGAKQYHEYLRFLNIAKIFQKIVTAFVWM